MIFLIFLNASSSSVKDAKHERLKVHVNVLHFDKDELGSWTGS